MQKIHIITPVKDSLATTLDTIRSVMESQKQHAAWTRKQINGAFAWSTCLTSQITLRPITSLFCRWHNRKRWQKVRLCAS